MVHKVPNDSVLSKALVVCSFRSIYNFKQKGSFGLSSFIFMHHFLMQFSVWYSCLPGTAVDRLLFLVGFSTASAKLIPQLFLKGLYTFLLSYTHSAINFYFPHLLWTPCQKVKEQLGLWLTDVVNVFERKQQMALGCSATTKDFLPSQVCIWYCAQDSCSVLHCLVAGSFLHYPKMVWQDSGKTSFLM